MTDQQPHIAIVILNYNGRPLLEAYLPSVLVATYPNKSIWVVDNCSTDDSVSWLRQHHPAINLVVNKENGGFAKGYNEGLKDIKADYYLLLNSDVKVEPGFIEPVLEAMVADKRIAFAQPKMHWLRKPGSFEYAGAAGGLLDLLGYPFCRGRLFDQLETDLGQYDDSPFVFWASGACMFARADVYWQLGGFYEYFFMHSEEIDLCWRAQNEGYKILACGKTSVQHLGAASLQKESPKKTFLNFRNNLVMLARNMPAGRLTWVLLLRMGLDGLAALTFLLKGEAGSAGAVFSGWKAFIGWVLKHDHQKYPKNKGFKNLDGISLWPALLKRYL